MRAGDDPLNAWICHVCAREWPVPSLARSCELKHEVK